MKYKINFFSKSGHDRVCGQLLKVVESYLRNKTLVETWTIIGESELGQLLINAYERESKHREKRPAFKHSKSSKSIYAFLLFSTSSLAIFSRFVA